VIALLAVDRDMGIAGVVERGEREFRVAALGLLQAEDVGRATSPMRSRTELMFQVAMVKCKGQPVGGGGRRRMRVGGADASAGATCPQA
jgi:hypothetical protein